MATADDTFNPAALTRTETLASTTGASKNATLSTPKQTKATHNYPRIDFEPVYSDLKDAIGHKWDIYFDAITRFIRGELHANEFGDLCDEILYATDNVLHLHNRFICAIAFNSARDNPEPGIAAWVTAASDKNAANASNKPALTSSDVNEQRLKKEVMALPARDRKRVKQAGLDTTMGAPTSAAKAAEEEAAQQAARQRNQYEEAYLASRIRVPETAAASTAGSSLTKTNWEIEIKKRYQQPLFTESSEFPEAGAVFARMVPMCYEESIPQGSSMACAELVATSAEFFFKDFLGTVFNRVRANGPRYETSAGGGTFTSKYKKQVEKELSMVKAGTLQRIREDDLLPVESKTAKARMPLGISDFKLANRVAPTLWNRAPLIGFEIENKPTEADYDDWKAEQEFKALTLSQTNGHVLSTGNINKQDAEEMDIDDDDDLDWDNEGFGDRGILDSLLDDCLKISAA